MVRYELAAFIRNAREVITDTAAEHQLIGQVYSRARGPAYRFLENYYHENDLEHDPFKVAQHESVSVQIDSILPLSKATWQVRWTEEASGLDGSPVATTHWEAALDTSIISRNLGLLDPGESARLLSERELAVLLEQERSGRGRQVAELLDLPEPYHVKGTESLSTSVSDACVGSVHPRTNHSLEAGRAVCDGTEGA
jgi:hypothetical protein